MIQSQPPSKAASTIYIGKWTAPILSSLREKPHRHGQLRRRLGSVSQRILTRTLRNLESAGLIARRVTRSKSVAVEYSLTPIGRAFVRIALRQDTAWVRRLKPKLLPSFGLPPEVFVLCLAMQFAVAKPVTWRLELQVSHLLVLALFLRKSTVIPILVV